MFAGVALATMFLMSRPAIAAARTHFFRFLLLGFVAVPVNVALFFVGASMAPPAHAALAYALTPVFVFIMEWLAKRTQATLQKVAGLCLAFGGAATVLLWKQSLAGPEPIGDLILLCAAASWAFYTVRSRPLVAELGAPVVMVLSLLFGTLLWLPIGIPVALDIPYAQLTAGQWTCVGYTALITTLVSYHLWLFGLKYLEPTQVAIFNNLQPVATVFLSWLISGAEVGPAILVATGMILSGVSLVQFASTRKTALQR